MASAKRPPPSPVIVRIEIIIDMDQMSRWPADKISAFFKGVAQVVKDANNTVATNVLLK